jgi:hypothetical protein
MRDEIAELAHAPFEESDHLGGSVRVVYGGQPVLERVFHRSMEVVGHLGDRPRRAGYEVHCIIEENTC